MRISDWSSDVCSSDLNDAIVGGHWQSGNGVNFESINQDESDRDRLYTIGGNFQQDFGDKVTLSLDASYSTANSYFENSGINVFPYVPDGSGGYVQATSVPGAPQFDYQLHGLAVPDLHFEWDLDRKSAVEGKSVSG